jgi:hypothetical protein
MTKTKSLSTLKRSIIKRSIFVIIFVILYNIINNNIVLFILVFGIVSNGLNLLLNSIDYISEKRLQKIKDDNQYKFNSEYYQKLLDEMLNDVYNKQRYGYSIQHKRRDELADAYQLFKLKPDCTIDDIKKTYRKYATIWHPDKWVTDTQENQEISKRNFQKLNSAYEIFKKHRNFN